MTTKNEKAPGLAALSTADRGEKDKLLPNLNSIIPQASSQASPKPNRFEDAHSRRGSLTPAQEKFLIKCDRETLSLARQVTGITKPIPRLSKKAAWLLIRQITQQAQGAGNG